MFEFHDNISTATSYIDSATKTAQSTVALISSITAVKASLGKFKEIFSKTHTISQQTMSVQELLNININKTLTDINNINGILVPIMAFKGEEEDNYKNVSSSIAREVSNLRIKSTENEFLTINSHEWLMYGCSLQSTTKDRIQLLSLIEEEEVKNVPVLVTNDYYRKKLNFPELNYGMQASLTGLMVSIDNNIVSALIGQEKAKNLKLKGQQHILVPDEEIIKDLNVDFSFKPNIGVTTDKCFFFGYLWVIYMDLHSGQIVPIYEYGNIGDKNSFIILSEKLIHQIEFFKKRVWNEFNMHPTHRRYKLLVAYNDDLFERIQSFFQDENYFEHREDILYNNREDIITNLFK